MHLNDEFYGHMIRNCTVYTELKWFLWKTIYKPSTTSALNIYEPCKYIKVLLTIIWSSKRFLIYLFCKAVWVKGIAKKK